MKKSKLTKNPVRVTSPFDAVTRKTKRTGNQKFVEWINQIIKDRHLPIGLAEQETVGSDRKQPDIIIYRQI